MGIMGGLASHTVDVRDMLCAQALALVAQAMERLAVGDALSIAHNAEDVKRDLLVWAAHQGHGTRRTGPSALEMTRGA